MFFTQAHIVFFCHRAFLVDGSQIIFILVFGLPNWLILPSVYTTPLRRLILLRFAKSIILTSSNLTFYCPVSWGCRIHCFYLYNGVRPHVSNECLGYDTKQYDGEVPIMLELWGIQSIPSITSLPSLLWPGVVSPDRILSMGQIELNCVLMINWIVWNRTVLTCKF